METKSPRKILVATDFSEGSDEAIDRAIEMAEQSGAAVEIMHVVELAEEFPFGTVHFDADYGALYASVDLRAFAARRPVQAGGPCLRNQDRRRERAPPRCSAAATSTPT